MSALKKMMGSKIMVTSDIERFDSDVDFRIRSYIISTSRAADETKIIYVAQYSYPCNTFRVIYAMKGNICIMVQCITIARCVQLVDVVSCDVMVYATYHIIIT